jgi:heptaprenyl diphosphate synthase
VRPSTSMTSPPADDPTPSPAASTFLTSVESALAAALPETGSLLSRLGRGLTLAPQAKRVRPILCERIGAHVQAPHHALVHSAAAVELMHTASLLHDDVVDDASTRRGHQTANAVAGNGRAVLAGDHVLVRALGLLQPYGPRVVEAALACVDAMTLSALLELEGRGDARFQLSQWREMAAGKTGALFALAARLPPLLVDDTDRATRFAKASSVLGVAFQILDDVLDLQPQTGKDRYQDLTEQNPSYITAWAGAHDATFQNDLAAAWGKGALDGDAAAAFAHRAVGLGAIDAAHAEVAACLDSARAAFGKDADARAIADVLLEVDALAGRTFARVHDAAA